MVRAKNAVSGPGKLSARTDMSPASQPTRVASGGAYGERQAMEQSQQAAPLAAANPSAAAGGGGGRPLPPGLSGGVFGPSERPTEPGTAMPQGMAQPIDDPDLLLRALYSQFPHPDIERLLSRRDR
jgi:hypothetical protein